MNQLGEHPDTPTFRTVSSPRERAWFQALEDIDTADGSYPSGELVLDIVWEGTDLDDFKASLEYLEQAGVVDIYGAIESDEGGGELWIFKNGELRTHEQWEGEPVITLFEQEEDLGDLLKRVRMDDLGGAA